MKIFSYLQKVGRSLMLPVAVLPAAALFLRFGSADLLGKFLGGDQNVIREAGLIAFKYMPLIFAAGVAIGIADDGHGTAVLAAILAFYTLNSVGLEWARMFFKGSADTIASNWDIGTIGGIAAGILAGETYNKYKNIKLPKVLSFFAAKRFVPMATLAFSVLLAGLFGLIWPTLQVAIQGFYNLVHVMPKAAQTGVYITSERLLIPFGLHHILNALFIFDSNYGDSIQFFQGVKGAGYIMAGAYPLKMFILPGLAAAIWTTSEKSKKTAIKTIMVSGALITFLTGITEPVEFTFLFLNPVLYLIYSLFAGVWGAIATATGALHGYGFSAGLIDYFLNFGIATKPILLLLVGLVSLPASYFFFVFIIKKFNMLTPGRGGDDEVVVAKKASSNSEYKDHAKKMLKALGGSKNIVSCGNCATRLRVKVKDSTVINKAMLKEAGALEVLTPSKTSVQVIVGPTVQYISDEIDKLI